MYRFVNQLNRCQRGNESMQSIAILGVGVLALVLFKAIQNGALSGVNDRLTTLLSGQRVDAPNAPSGVASLPPASVNGNQTSNGQPSSSTAPNQAGNTTASTAEGVTSKPSKDKDPEFDIHKVGQVATDLANEFREEVAKAIGNKLGIEIPKQAGKLDDMISDLYGKLAKVDLADFAGRKDVEDKLSQILKERFADLEDVKIGLEGKLKIDKNLSPILSNLGNLIGLDEMLTQDRENYAIGHDPNTTLEQRYEAYRATFGIAGSQLVSGVLSKFNINPVGDFLVSELSEEAGKAIADAAFTPINDFTNWLWENGYSPRPPTFPRGFKPPVAK